MHPPMATRRRALPFAAAPPSARMTDISPIGRGGASLDELVIPGKAGWFAESYMTLREESETTKASESSSGGVIDATMTGGYVEELLEYEDASENVWNFYVTLTSSMKTSGGTASYNTSRLINSGTYAVYDPAKAYAVKIGTLSISGGLVRVRCTGTCGRGLGADSMFLSGGVYDIFVAGGPTDVHVEPLVEADDLTGENFETAVTTCLDAGGAACLKTSGEDGVLSITGGTFKLEATGTAGKLINAGGALVIGEDGAVTLPTDSTFAPDIQGQALGS